MPLISDEAYLDAVERGRAAVTAHLAPAPRKAAEVAAEHVSPSPAAPNVPGVAARAFSRRTLLLGVGVAIALLTVGAIYELTATTHSRAPIQRASAPSAKKSPVRARAATHRAVPESKSKLTVASPASRTRPAGTPHPRAAAAVVTRTTTATTKRASAGAVPTGGGTGSTTAAPSPASATYGGSDSTPPAGGGVGGADTTSGNADKVASTPSSGRSGPTETGAAPNGAAGSSGSSNSQPTHTSTGTTPSGNSATSGGGIISSGGG